MTDQPQAPQHPKPQDYWKNRRIMAYWSMTGLSAVLVKALVFGADAGTVPLLTSLCWVFCANIGMYYGGNAAELFGKLK